MPTINIRIIVIGKLKEKFYQKGVDHYLKRLSPYARVNIIEIAEAREKGRGASATRQVLYEEGRGIQRCLSSDSYLLVLTQEGKVFTSAELALHLEMLLIQGKSKIDIVIGGPLGLSEEVKEKGDLLLSLSELTFPHRLARLIILEQLYRCFKINKSEPYHR